MQCLFYALLSSCLYIFSFNVIPYVTFIISKTFSLWFTNVFLPNMQNITCPHQLAHFNIDHQNYFQTSTSKTKTKKQKKLPNNDLDYMES